MTYEELKQSLIDSGIKVPLTFELLNKDKQRRNEFISNVTWTVKNVLKKMEIRSYTLGFYIDNDKLFLYINESADEKNMKTLSYKEFLSIAAKKKEDKRKRLESKVSYWYEGEEYVFSTKVDKRYVYLDKAGRNKMIIADEQGFVIEYVNLLNNDDDKDI